MVIASMTSIAHCTDAWRALSTYAKSKGLEHYQFKSDGTERAKGLYHIQNVNNYHSRFATIQWCCNKIP